MNPNVGLKIAIKKCTVEVGFIWNDIF